MNALGRTAVLVVLCLGLTGCPQAVDSLLHSTAPHFLSASKGEGTGVSLSWSPPSFPDTDKRTVSQYRVFRDGSSVASTTSTSWTDTGVAPRDSHSYEVSAILDNGAETGRSNSDSGWYVPGKPLLWGDVRGTFSTPGTVGSSNSGWYKTLLVAGWTYHLRGTSGAEILDWDSPRSGDPVGPDWTARKTGKVWIQIPGQGPLEAWHD